MGIGERGLVAIVFGSWLFAAPAAAEEAVSAEARAYFRNAVELLEQENYQDAYYQLKLAYEKSQSWKVLGNWGLAAFKLERDDEALRHYQVYLNRGGKEIAREEREAIERDMLLIRGNTATLRLESPSPFELQTSRRGSSVPVQTYAFGAGNNTLLLRAGTYRLTATRADGRTNSWELVLTPGSAVDRTVTFSAPKASAASTQPAPSRSLVPRPSPSERQVAGDLGTTQQRSTGLFVTGLVVTGLGLAALGAGTWLGLKAKEKEDFALETCDTRTKVCTEDRREDFDDADRYARNANIAFIAGGVATVAGAVLTIYGGASTAKRTARVPPLRWTPIWTPGHAGLAAAGNF